WCMSKDITLDYWQHERFGVHHCHPTSHMSDSKEEILNKAFKLFLRENYKEVTIQDIVDSVGMTKGAFYYFYKSKEQLFKEIVDRFLLPKMKIDYTAFSQDSLYQFYHDYVNYIYQAPESFRQNQVDYSDSVNFYLLIFDALKIIPDFHKTITELHMADLRAWKGIIQTARNKGEIKSNMDDEQLADIFMYISNGVGLRNITERRIEDDNPQMLKLCDAFYEELKARI
ncbi:MAG: TetR/AcrR family transcriptional regulator, partial [Dehalococcoidia bacterium]|nr:TetR/AcrR family transcriptional regulator [Dehalococcoidia bacterium]